MNSAFHRHQCAAHFGLYSDAMLLGQVANGVVLVLGSTFYPALSCP